MCERLGTFLVALLYLHVYECLESMLVFGLPGSFISLFKLALYSHDIDSSHPLMYPPIVTLVTNLPTQGFIYGDIFLSSTVRHMY